MRNQSTEIIAGLTAALALGLESHEATASAVYLHAVPDEDLAGYYLAIKKRSDFLNDQRIAAEEVLHARYAAMLDDGARVMINAGAGRLTLSKITRKLFSVRKLQQFVTGLVVEQCYETVDRYITRTGFKAEDTQAKNTAAAVDAQQASTQANPPAEAQKAAPATDKGISPDPSCNCIFCLLRTGRA